MRLKEEKRRERR